MIKTTLLSKRLLSYAGMATGMIVAHSNVAEAQIVYTDINPDYHLPDLTWAIYELDVNNDGIVDFEFHVEGSETIGSSYSCSWSSKYVVALGDNGVLNEGEPYDNDYLIKSQDSWDSYGEIIKLNCNYQPSYGGYCDCNNVGNWGNAEASKFLGLRFVKDNLTFYGWIRLKKDGHYLEDFAFQTIPDTPISAGQIENCDTLHINTSPMDSIHMCIPGEEINLLAIHPTITYDINFHWLKNSVVIPSATTNTLIVDGPGIYSAVINGYGCADSSSAIPITYNTAIAPPPVITQHLDTLFSSYQTNYVWFNSGTLLPNATGQFLEIDEDGSYQCGYLDLLNCISETSSFNATTCAGTIVTINQGSVGVICANETFWLCSFTIPSNCTYQWLSDDVPISAATYFCHTASFPGNYTIAIESYAGCRDTSNNFSLIGDTVPVPTITMINDTTLQSSSPTGNQWYLNGAIINGATSQTYIATENGYYYVKVTNGNNCSSNSMELNVNITGIPHEPTKMDFNVFAINQQLHIQFTQMPLHGKMTLIDLPGNNIFESLIDQSIMTFDVSHLPDGIYFVIISDEKSRFVKKVFIGA